MVFTEIKLRRSAEDMSSCPVCDGKPRGHSSIGYFRCKSCGTEGCMYCLIKNVSNVRVSLKRYCKHCGSEFVEENNPTFYNDYGNSNIKKETFPHGYTGITRIGSIKPNY